MKRVCAQAFVPVMVVCAIAHTNLYGQGGGGRGGAPQSPRTARQSAPIDIAGYWVALVTEDWRFRMLTPPKGDVAGIPLNPEGRRLAAAWDPAKDDSAGEQCKAYGAPGLMRIPGRLHITWQDDQTMKLETDAGSQTRLFYFGAPAGEGGDWQGLSKANWEILPAQLIATDGAHDGASRPSSAGGALRVITTKLKPGYLRKNGPPYSAKAVLTEFFDRVNEPNGDSYLILTATLEDPTYLAQPYRTSTQFKKQADAANWNPTPCSVQ
jgi:hypothetical protein